MYDMSLYIYLYMYDSVVNLGGILVRRERWVSDGVIVGESASVSQYVQDTLIVCKYSKLDAISTNNEYYMIPVSTNAKKLLLMDTRS